MTECQMGSAGLYVLLAATSLAQHCAPPSLPGQCGRLRPTHGNPECPSFYSRGHCRFRSFRRH